MNDTGEIWLNSPVQEIGTNRNILRSKFPVWQGNETYDMRNREGNWDCLEIHKEGI